MSRARPIFARAFCGPAGALATGMGQFCVITWNGSVRPSSMRNYTLGDFDFALPADLIAQHPAPERSASRLLDGTGADPVDRTFRDLPSLLHAGDLVVFNDPRVVKARPFREQPP